MEHIPHLELTRHPGPCFNVKISFIMHKDSHYKDKTVSPPPYLYKGNSYSCKIILRQLQSSTSRASYGVSFVFCINLILQLGDCSVGTYVFIVCGIPLHWHHYERDGISNHRRLNCLFNCLLRRRSKKTSKIRVTGLYEWNSPVTIPRTKGQ